MWADIQLIDWLLLIVRWIHIITAVLWLGSSLFLWIVVIPVSKQLEVHKDFIATIVREFGGVVNISVLSLVVTGSILTTARLSIDNVSLTWISVFGIKMATVLWIFWSVFRARRSTVSKYYYNSATVAGVIVFFISSLLHKIIEESSA